MRFITLPLLLIGSLASVSCDRALRSQQPPEKWTTGFWYWHGSSPGPWQHVQPLEVLFFQAAWRAIVSPVSQLLAWSAIA